MSSSAKYGNFVYFGKTRVEKLNLYQSPLLLQWGAPKVKTTQWYDIYIIFPQ